MKHVRRKTKHAMMHEGSRQSHRAASLSSTGVGGSTGLDGMYFHPLTSTAEMNK